MDLPKHIDPAKTLCITPGNLTAFAWYLIGFPEAIRLWNEIDHQLYTEQRAPDLDKLNELLRNLIMANIGATVLGLTASISGTIGLRVIAANLVQTPNPAQYAQRKADFLRGLDIADRFDDLTVRRFWHERNNIWRTAILGDNYFCGRAQAAFRFRWKLSQPQKNRKAGFGTASQCCAEAFSLSLLTVLTPASDTRLTSFYKTNGIRPRELGWSSIRFIQDFF
jgi:hypothetical protein